MKIKPLADRVLVEPSELEETKSNGGIIIPDTAKEKPQQGKWKLPRWEPFQPKMIHQLGILLQRLWKKSAS